MKKCLLIITLMVWCVSVWGQHTSRLHQYEEKEHTDNIIVSLITYYPGEQIYELYGHSGLRVVLPDGRGILYNYGIFDFGAPNFVYRFVKGETDYKVKGYSDVYMLHGYSGRKVVEQVLNLSQEQALKTYEYLVENALPWNATYRYNYVLDNCSTRPRDIIEMATDGTLEYPAMRDTTTFRKMMHRYNENYAWSRFGIDIALGEGLDYTLDYRKQMFVPMVLMEACAGATIMQAGERVPLVKCTNILNEGSDTGSVLPPTPWWATPISVFVALFFVMALFTWRDIKRGKVTRWVDSLLYGFLAIYGLLLFFLIFISTHEATSPNWHGLWLNPFYLLPTVLIWIKSAKKLLYCYHFVNFALLIALMVMWYWIPQKTDVAVFPLILCSVMRSINYILIFRKKKTDAK